MTTFHRVRAALATLATLALVVPATPAAADPHAAIVLRTDGSADAAARAQVDALVLRLVKQGGLTATAGDITFSDGAAATGCTPDAASCRDDVMSMLSVDELIWASASSLGNDVRVVVRRATKGAPPREATGLIALNDHSDAALIAAIAPLFGVAQPVPTPPAPEPGHPPPQAAPFAAPDAAGGATGAAPTVTGAPDNQIAPEAMAAPSTHHKLYLTGAIAGGALAALGIVLWGAAKHTENEIQSAPTSTSADFQHLHDLEQQGDSQANGGNFLFVTGAVLGGVSGYFLYRDHQRAASAQHARIVPLALDHGAGLALTFGGTP